MVDTATATTGTTSDDMIPATSSHNEIMAVGNETSERQHQQQHQQQQQEGIDSSNKLDPVGSLRPSSTTKLDALVAVAAAQVAAKEIEDRGMAISESGTSDNEEDEVDDGLQQQQNREQKLTASRDSVGEIEEVPGEEKKDASLSETTMDQNAVDGQEIEPKEDVVTVEDVPDKSEGSDESLVLIEKVGSHTTDSIDASANDNHSPSDEEKESDDKKPVDASGVCSLEPSGNQEELFDAKDPPQTILEETGTAFNVNTSPDATTTIETVEDPPEVETKAAEETKAAAPVAATTIPAIVIPSLNLAPVPIKVDKAAAESSPAVKTPRATNTSNLEDVVPAPLDTVERETSDETNTEPTLEDDGDDDTGSPKSQMSRSQLLANKDKEGFGLMARGESFSGAQQQQQQQQDEILAQVKYDDPSRVPQEPDAEHRRGDSSLASVTHQVPTTIPATITADVNNNGSRMMDDNSGRPIDDWRPAQLSYPASPNEMRHTQTIALSNGGYMVMPPPHNQGQPPHAFMPQAPAAIMHHQASFHSHQAQIIGGQSFGYQAMPPAMAPAMAPAMPSPAPLAAPGGKRKIKLRLQEEILARPTHGRRKSFFFGGTASSRKNRERTISEGQDINEVDRGNITISWFEGTSSSELQEHVNRSVSRKLKLGDKQTLDDIRILDTKVDPPEEIVLCPYIPNGEEFVLRYKLTPVDGRTSPTRFYGPPDSPSAAPSPFPHGNLGSLDAGQLSVLRKRLDEVQDGEPRGGKYKGRKKTNRVSPMKPKHDILLGSRNESPVQNRSRAGSDHSDAENDSETNTLQPEENSVDAKLRQITELLLADNKKAQLAQQQRNPVAGKRDVIMVLANYFMLFVALITISAEMQARAPRWLSWMETQLENVQNCSADQDALFQCVSNGEFAGLFASVILWLSRSALTKQIFLLGFDSPQKLWTVFYESLVGAFCWGFSYMLIRRGMNPDTRPQFLQRYWKDAVYGSLAGFNATFMKQVLKNLIPQEAVEEAFNDRQLKILSWLPTFS